MWFWWDYGWVVFSKMGSHVSLEQIVVWERVIETAWGLRFCVVRMQAVWNDADDLWSYLVRFELVTEVRELSLQATELVWEHVFVQEDRESSVFCVGDDAVDDLFKFFFKTFCSCFTGFVKSFIVWLICLLHPLFYFICSNIITW